MEVKKLTVVIVNYNVKYYLEQCLLSLRRALENVDAEVYVVDNDSRDDSVAYLAPRFPEVKIIASRHNLGFARANNLAIQSSSSEYVLLLNPDTFLGEHVIQQCLAFMDAHPHAGGVGVRMLHSDGTDAKESRRGFPSPLTAFYKMSGLCERFPKNHKLGKYYMGYLPWDEPGKIEVISGAFCFLRRCALDEVGLLDEDFFMYGEDIDLSYRVLKGGYENWYLPYRILHYKGESTQRSSYRYVHVFYEAMLIFFRKHYGHLSLFLSLPIKAAVIGKAAITLVQMQWWRTVKALGLLRNTHQVYPKYVFIGSEKSIADCRRIAQEKALIASFHVGTHQSLPQGHLDMMENMRKTEPIVVVYDITAYTFEQILNIFARKPHDNISIGTYNPDNQLIITGAEVI